MTTILILVSTAILFLAAYLVYFLGKTIADNKRQLHFLTEERKRRERREMRAGDKVICIEEIPATVFDDQLKLYVEADRVPQVARCYTVREATKHYIFLLEMDEEMQFLKEKFELVV